MSEGLGGPWPGGAKAAYSLIHDDIGQPEADGFFEHAVPQLEARDLRCGFAVTVSTAAQRGLLPQIRDLVERGHEAINHSWSHKNLTEHRDYASEVDHARTVLEQATARPVTFFAFPFDAFDDESIAHLRREGYRGARAGPRGVNPSQPGDDFAVRFDTYGGEYSVYEGDVLEAHVQAAIKAGGWAVRELHGVADRSWQSIPLSDYCAHLDAVAERVERGELWVAPPSAVLLWRRHRARLNRPFPRLSGNTVPC